MQATIRHQLKKVIHQTLHLKRPDNENQLKELSDEGKALGYFPRDFGMDEWDWPQGIGLYGLNKLTNQAGFDVSRDFFVNWSNHQIARGLPLKNVNTTAPLLTLMDLPHIEKLALEWMEWVEHECPRTTGNGIQHVTSGNTSKFELNLHDQEIWIDTLFMVVLFIAKMGKAYKNPAWMNEASDQFALHIKHIFHPDNSLFFHGYDFKNQNNFSEAHWCRGNSWFTLAAPEFVEIMQDDLTTESRDLILGTYRAQVDKLIELQSETGLWHTLLDDKDSYTEVSGSAAIAAGILKGVRLGLLDDSYLAYCRKAVAAVLANISEDGTVLNVSAGTPICETKEDYKKIVFAPTAYGQALVIVLLAEALFHPEL
ncbi:unsaturated rhamnogalacturonyl hydrolase [Paenibacillus sp. UNCCL117]|uniref:glycoside hydrolase family 88/105 protein n=1 Tax=unclassified Paenibacillus TaxID=185978 RepID=UPI0008877D79|nr:MULTISPECIES: glycoside hydrolase family 88 protein [unclassified Paenibacillus]SDD03434.1 unsaturated rhamnogalacturonyl hydrolase [Paenibacillus sp. cl123]SFW32310.1 unsaturated rhamnogalacturonyl hydrolase [Paenibacillus sp. UNCCL117]